MSKEETLQKLLFVIGFPLAVYVGLIIIGSIISYLYYMNNGGIYDFDGNPIGFMGHIKNNFTFAKEFKTEKPTSNDRNEEYLHRTTAGLSIFAGIIVLLSSINFVLSE